MARKELGELMKYMSSSVFKAISEKKKTGHSLDDLTSIVSSYSLPCLSSELY